ncbi:MAG: non-ribosomal peptide synthetase [Trichormus sp.]
MEKQLVANEYPRNKCIHLLFEEQVKKTPDAVAIIFQGQQLTYSQLNHRANQLAKYLQTLGVGAEILVGICLERSLEMIIGVLAILKAGGAYVPLDIGYPQDRLAFMLEDTQLPVLLTQKQLLDKLPQHQAHVICLDTDWEMISQQTSENLNTSIKAENLAYVMYTSGSTGKPKGVQIEHQSVVNLLNSIRQEPGLTSEDVLLAVASLSFDISVSEIFLPLSVGAKLVLASREVIADGKQLLKLQNIHGVTFMQPTPATWRLLLAAGWQGSPQLKMISTGEALPRDLANQLLTKGSTLWNLYGPTETTIWSTGCQVTTGDESINIGHPIANTQTYILNSDLQPVPMGTEGELYIGGAGLARGYLNRPDLTAEKFIPNPFSSDPRSRLYKTGDLARYLPDGNIQYLGRIDHQVKIRGFRIELAEIEREISQYPDVRENIVLARQQEGGEKYLVAYIVLHQNNTYQQNQLRSFLQQRLPQHMLPSAFVVLQSLPLTPNGKVDRNQLPVPSRERPQLEQPYIAPRTDLQKLLATIWSDFLNIDQVGIEDNFFDLGGTSTLIMQIAVRIEQELGIELSVVKLFQYPTIAGLVKYLNPEQNSQQSYDKLQNRAQRQQAAVSARRRHSPRGV